MQVASLGMQRELGDSLPRLGSPAHAPEEADIGNGAPPQRAELPLWSRSPLTGDLSRLARDLILYTVFRFWRAWCTVSSLLASAVLDALTGLHRPNNAQGL